MDVSMTFKVIGDYRPQLKGRVYSLSPFGGSTQPGNWLSDAEPTQVSKEKKAKQAKTAAAKPNTGAPLVLKSSANPAPTAASTNGGFSTSAKYF